MLRLARLLPSRPGCALRNRLPLRAINAARTGRLSLRYRAGFHPLRLLLACATGATPNALLGLLLRVVPLPLLIQLLVTLLGRKADALR
jgi:hypothetical protein